MLTMSNMTIIGKWPSWVLWGSFSIIYNPFTGRYYLGLLHSPVNPWYGVLWIWQMLVWHNCKSYVSNFLFPLCKIRKMDWIYSVTCFRINVGGKVLTNHLKEVISYRWVYQIRDLSWPFLLETFLEMDVMSLSSVSSVMCRDTSAFLWIQCMLGMWYI